MWILDSKPYEAEGKLQEAKLRLTFQILGVLNSSQINGVVVWTPMFALISVQFKGMQKSKYNWKFIEFQSKKHPVLQTPWFPPNVHQEMWK